MLGSWNAMIQTNKFCKSADYFFQIGNTHVHWQCEKAKCLGLGTLYQPTKQRFAVERIKYLDNCIYNMNRFHKHIPSLWCIKELVSPDARKASLKFIPLSNVKQTLLCSLNHLPRNSRIITKQAVVLRNEASQSPILRRSFFGGYQAIGTIHRSWQTSLLGCCIYQTIEAV